MAVKAQYQKLADVPEGLKSDYKEVNGIYLLDVDGGNTATHVPKAELDKVVEESKDRKAKLAKYKDIDPDKYAADLAELTELRKVGGDLETRVSAATSRLKTELQTATDANAVLKGRIGTLVLDNSFQALAAKAGVRPEAVPDFISRAKNDFEEKDGALSPKNNAKGKDGNALTPQEWANERKADAAHLFLGSSGGGSGESSSKEGGGGNSTKNPYRKGPEWNLTQQGLLELSNPTEAARLQSEAAVATAK